MTAFVIEVGGRTYRRHPKHGHWELTSHAGTWLPPAIQLHMLDHIEALTIENLRLENDVEDAWERGYEAAVQERMQ